ncbi:MAG: hypothetical protein NTU51_10280 [Bacteroidetes bacterium]|nr:hypothetical protein [Bacteroidota bacterium]
MEDKVYIRMWPVIRFMVSGVMLSCLFILACTKHSTDTAPLPVWEDTGADSVRLRINVQNSQGLVLYGQYVNLALSRDSLNANMLVRRIATNTSGTSVFSRLYPRIIYYNCYAITSGQTYFGSGVARLLPGINKDTLLIVH